MFFGAGMLKGLAVTFKNFVDSYFRKPDEGGIFTVQYPEEKAVVKENFRNFPFLVFDQNPDEPRCVACDICAKECPPKCIFIVRDFDKEGRPLKKPAVFDIDHTICMNCGICEEACPFDAIFMDHNFEIASADRQGDLLFHKENLLKPNTYFHSIRPTDATAIDTRLREAEEKKKAAEAAAKARAQQQQKAPPPQPGEGKEPPKTPPPGNPAS